jgi:HPt (histidine-containing phosphotransfer) domain-containing protein
MVKAKTDTMKIKRRVQEWKKLTAYGATHYGQLLLTQINQKKALQRATHKLMVKEGFYDLVYMEKLDEEIKQLKKELKEEKYAQAQKDIQLLESQIIQKKAINEALSVVDLGEGVTVEDLGVDTGNLWEEIEQLEKKYAQAQKYLQDNAATSSSSVLMAEKIVSIDDA